MPHPSWDNPRDFVALDDFAIQAVITLQDGTTRTVAGVFDDPYMNAQLGEYDMDTTRPRLSCVESDLAGVSRFDRVVIAGRTYGVMTEPQPDGTGLAVLALEPE